MTPDLEPCPICKSPTARAILDRAHWLSPDVRSELSRKDGRWSEEGGACPACVETALLQVLLDRGDEALHEGIQSIWPLDAEAAFGAIPTPLRLHSDPRYTGNGITIAMVDGAFYPHPDLIKPANRIRAWADAAKDPVQARFFGRDETPAWPGWDAGDPGQWHGQMTSVVAAGNGHLSHGLYRGMASEADLVLIQTYDADGRITNETIERALRWLKEHAQKLGVRVINMSLGGEAVETLRGNPVDFVIAELFRADVSVVVAAGNDGARSLVPPATAPQAITVGGLDDDNTFQEDELRIWHSNYGDTAFGAHKPEIVAPSIWVAAPVLPVSELAREAEALFERRKNKDATAEQRIKEQKLITPHYQHVDGTSFAAPIVSGAIACMYEANPKLTPFLVREVLRKAAHPIPDVPAERQGAGALDAGKAVSFALREHSGPLAGHPLSPDVSPTGICFLCHDVEATSVAVRGSWDKWSSPGIVGRLIQPGLWKADLSILPPGRYVYKFLIDGARWLDDPANPVKSPDGTGGLNSVLEVRDFF